jgi:hypothetical protein
MAGFVVFVSACAGKCDQPAPTRWPKIPASAVEADALVTARTKRPIAPRLPELDAARIASMLTSGTPIVGGWTAIKRWANASVGTGDAWLLVGTHHDSAAPVEAFERFLDPDPPSDFTRFVLEQLTADGAWEGAPPAEQRGDSEPLARYMRDGSPDAYKALLASQDTHDYAAWKYDYTRSVLEVLTMARGASRTVSACDAPRALLARFPEASRMRLRELHCLLALERDLPPGRRRVAMLWGEEHVQPDGFARFLPPEARVVVVRIPRESPVTVLDPLLVDDPEGAALLLPDATRNRVSDHVRERTANIAAHSLHASARSEAELRIDGRVLALGPTPRDEDLSPGKYPFVVSIAHRPRVAGLLVVPQGGEAELRIEDTEPIVTITERTVR